ncbi:MFS transporter [Sphingopyxis sp.]|uniref:MFS transporter n=1 Tax=Sphingopyxis sp. TaxID=1908224 RepID=UPI003D810E76
MIPAPGQPAPFDKPSPLNRAVGASALGNAVEWFDYGIYAYGVTYISAALFPGDTEEAVLFALATFAISFLVRPLGGLFWGPLGDRIGRKSVLAMTILLMAGATFAVGLIPSYDSIGFWAPTILILLRMLQGFSTGGEYGGAATFMAEYAPDDRRGFYGSFLEFGTLAGFSFGAALMLGYSLHLGSEAMHEWGWRIPFLIAGPVGLVGMYLRSKLEDTPVFREEMASADRRKPPGIAAMMREHWRPLLVVGGLVVALNVVNYSLLSYMPTYLQRRIGLSNEQALIVPIIGMIFMMVFLPFAGALSDRIGRRPMWRWSLIGLLLLVVPLYMLIGTGFAGAIVGFMALGLLYVPQLATISATFPAMFPTAVRFAGFAIAYNLSTSIFGGTAPMIGSGLIGLTGDPLMPAYYMMLACIVGLVALRFMPETAGTSLRDDPFARRPPIGKDQVTEARSL